MRIQCPAKTVEYPVSIHLPPHTLLEQEEQRGSFSLVSLKCNKGYKNMYNLHTVCFCGDVFRPHEIQRELMAGKECGQN